MKPQVYFMLALTPLALASCTENRSTERPPVTPAAKVTGPAVSCIPITAYSETRIRDDWTIDFLRAGGRQGWRVTLPYRCNGLKAEDAFTYETSLTQLCSSDIIHVLYRTGGTLQKGVGCGMGQFTPIEIER